MPSYSTIEEKAAEWNISLRHIQHLCRLGKIDGAVKRAGAWSIPDDAPTPAKYTKSSDKGTSFVGTKNRIFVSAIELSVKKGFESVSFKDIADSVGIRQSTIYSHFKTKQEILDAMYDYYSCYYLKDRLSPKEMESIIQKESLANIIGSIRYEFKDEYQQILSDITKIIFQRLGIDSRAREIVRSLIINDGIEYVENVFNHAVRIGRFAPFDTHIMAVFINVVRIFTLCCRVLEHDSSPGYAADLREDEYALYKYALEFLVDLRRPETNSWDLYDIGEEQRDVLLRKRSVPTF